MKEISNLNKFEQHAYSQDGSEYWLARELQELLGYSDWRNFLNAIDKAKESCKTTGESVQNHFVDATKMVQIGSGAKRKQDDIMLSRYACYLIAQNGDPKKEQIALAQSYFAVQTRKQELIIAQQITPKLPTLEEALELALAQVRKNKALEAKNAQLETTIQAQAPKVLFADAVSASTTCILVGDLAKLLNQNGIDIGANRLFEWLRKNGYLINRKGTDWNLPTQRAMALKLFEIKESVHISSTGENHIAKTPKVTGKGQTYFLNKFLDKVEFPRQANVLVVS